MTTNRVNTQGAIVGFPKDRPTGGFWHQDTLLSVLVLLIPFSSFLGPSNSFSRLLFVGFAGLIIVATAFYRGLLTKIEETTPVALILVFLLLIQFIIVDQDTVFVNYYIGPILGLSASLIGRRAFEKVAVAFLVVQAGLQFYEYFTQSFIFDSISLDGSVFDVEVVRGNQDVFRSKGLADGPTSLGAFLVFVAILLRGNLLALSLIMVCCALAAARLGLLIISTIYIVDLIKYLRDRSDRPVLLFVSTLLALSGVASALIWLMSTSSSSFLLSALDVQNNNNNIDRLNFIYYGFWYVSQMGIQELIFGSDFNLKNNGVFFESSWLGILAQSGILLLLVYLLSLFRGIHGSVRELHGRFAILAVASVAATLDPLGGSMLMFMVLGQAWLAEASIRKSR